MKQHITWNLIKIEDVKYCNDTNIHLFTNTRNQTRDTSINR